MLCYSCLASLWQALGWVILFSGHLWHGVSFWFSVAFFSWAAIFRCIRSTTISSWFAFGIWCDILPSVKSWRPRHDLHISSVKPHTIIVSCFQTFLSTLTATSHLWLLGLPLHALTAVYFVSIADDPLDIFFCVYSACSISLHWPNFFFFTLENDPYPLIAGQSISMCDGDLTTLRTPT